MISDSSNLEYIDANITVNILDELGLAICLQIITTSILFQEYLELHVAKVISRYNK